MALIVEHGPLSQTKLGVLTNGKSLAGALVDDLEKRACATPRRPI
ncbi:MAG: hypothetical protein CM15mP49_34740 [Actinomycetota bacterium]|nr:MAG: hypothetical protein CM15mP49_34740 [Actinomycetota bacterium]